MKLKRIRTLPYVKLIGRVPGDLHEALVGYAEYYRTVHGEPIEVWPLVVQMLRTFVDDDREYTAPAALANMRPRPLARHLFLVLPRGAICAGKPFERVSLRSREGGLSETHENSRVREGVFRHIPARRTSPQV